MSGGQFRHVKCEMPLESLGDWMDQSGVQEREPD